MKKGLLLIGSTVALAIILSSLLLQIDNRSADYVFWLGVIVFLVTLYFSPKSPVND